jgi:hypothetical protein
MPYKPPISHREVIARLGNHCQRCGCRDAELLQVDHVDGDGSVERKAKGGQQAIYRRIMKGDGNYRCLCAGCNCRLRHKSKAGRKPREVTDESMEEFMSILKTNLERLLS